MPNMNSITVLLLAFAVIAIDARGDFRFGKITWRRVQSSDGFEVEFDIVLGLDLSAEQRLVSQVPVEVTPYKVGDDYDFRGVQFHPGGGLAPVSLSAKVSKVVAEDAIFFTNPVIRVKYPSAGPFNAEFSTDSPFNPITRYAGLRNNDVLVLRLSCVVNMNNNNWYSPTVAVPWLVQIDERNEPRFLPKWRFIEHDADGQDVTFRTADAIEFGDNPEDEFGQQSSQPPNYEVDAGDGTIKFDVPPISGQQKRHWNSQVFFIDSEGGSSVVDFIIHTKQFAEQRPSVGGNLMAPNYDYNSIVTANPVQTERVLINKKVEFDVQASRFDVLALSVKTIHAIEPYSNLAPVSSSDQSASTKLAIFDYTPRVAGIRPMCFFAIDTNGAQSRVKCMFHDVVGTPLLTGQFHLPSIQVVTFNINFYFTGTFLHKDDRVAIIPVGDNCEDLKDEDGQRVNWVGKQEIRKSRTVDLLTQSSAIVRAPIVGMAKLCYKKNGAGSEAKVPWEYVPDRNNNAQPISFQITNVGPHTTNSLVSLPVNNRYFTYLIDGIQLQRFDKVKFVRPDVEPPGLGREWSGTIPTDPCNSLQENDGTMLKEWPRTDVIEPGIGFVRGNERAEFPHVHVFADEGLFMCYWPKVDEQWRLIYIVRRPQATGPWAVVSARERRLEPGTVDITLRGVLLIGPPEVDHDDTDDTDDKPEKQGHSFAYDTVQAFARSNDCSQMGQPSLFSDDEERIFLGDVTSVRLGPGPACVAPDCSITSFSISGESTAGINFFTLCYRHMGNIIRIAEIPFRQIDFEHVGIPDPITTTPDFPWVDYRPLASYVGIETTLEFVGFGPYSWMSKQCADCGECETPWVKVAVHGSCTGNTPGGEPKQLTRDRRASFKIEEVGSFRICIKHRNDWEEVARDYQVMEQPKWDKTAPFNGFRTCAEFLQHGNNKSKNLCGCYVTPTGNENRYVDADTTFLVNPSTATDFGINQGCCEDPNSERVVGGQVTLTNEEPKWGYCKLDPVVHKLPLFNQPKAK
eukprot:TRINITY_DN48851_c0_g1_i1.p1 TRINITY_DN48851_c0_g1~~TRINITY_DN48851_c0_g1_i1.p1  ORF type:complete len:1020 (-),score=115.14 TRINITY_DN48851_c0_g1_i1:465-3524(-)